MDYALLRDVNGWARAHDGVEDLLLRYAQVSELIFVAMVAALFVLLRGPEHRRAAIAAALSAGLALLVVHLLAGVVDRPRPFVSHPGSVTLFLPHAADPSFPSEHATGAFAIAFAVWLRMRAWGAVALALAAVLALSRVALGVHYPADVVAGALAGIGAALVVWIPAVRRRSDALADRVAGVWDGAIARVRPRPAA